MMYTVRCNCGSLGYFDERPEIRFTCWECQRKAQLFKRKRKIVEKRIAR